MKRLRGILITALALAAIPTVAGAAPSGSLKNTINEALTWSIAHIDQRHTQGLPMKSAKNWFAPAGNRADANMGFFLGKAYTPPPSVIGWDNHEDLLSKVRYGIYLVNRF